MQVCFLVNIFTQKLKIMKNTINSRLLSLDVLRGITIAGMILVNNPGNKPTTYAPLLHAPWDGLTPTDLIFPFFVFIMGVSLYLSYRKFDFKFSKQTFLKLLRRSVLLFLVGLAIGWFGLFCKELNALHGEDLSLLQKIGQSAWSFENLRILGVLQRLALVSLFGSIIVLLVRPRFIPYIAGGILLFYWLLVGATNSFLPTEDNIVGIVDKAILGASHMYKIGIDGVRITFDPEGLLSTLPCIAHVLLGFWAGKLISETSNNYERIQKLLLFGTIILFIGLLISYGCPINKKMWSSSYVLVSCGFASLLFGLLIWIIDIKGHKRWSRFFESFGVNPMIIYVFAEVLSVLLNNIRFESAEKWISIKTFSYNHFFMPVFGNYFGSLVFALIFVGICWSFGYVLYKKKIYVKL